MVRLICLISLLVLSYGWQMKAIRKAFISTTIASQLLAPALPGLLDRAQAFGEPAGLSDLKEKPSNYGRLADVGVRQFLVKDGKQHLRLALPLETGKGVKFTGMEGQNSKEVRDELELIRLRLDQVGFTNKNAWGGAATDISNIATILGKDKASLQGKANSNTFEKTFASKIGELSEGIKTQDADKTFALQEELAAAFNDIQEANLPKKKLPYSISDEYKGLPKLLGRATVEMVLETKGQRGKGFEFPDLHKNFQETFTIVVDGYTHPLTAGNFVDLVDKKFYDNTPLKAEELIVQTLKSEGYKKQDGEVRTIPLELFYKIDNEPTYSITSDDENRALDTQKLPFQAFGALGMARGNDDVDSGSADFFFLKWTQPLVPPGRNTLDGYYSCFGYIVSDNQDLLKQMGKGDKIVSARVISGIDNLQK